MLLGVYFFLNQSSISTLNADDKDFSFKNTNQIDKIFMKNKFTNEFVTLTKVSDNEWKVNGKHIGNIYQIDILLETLRKIRVRKPVALNFLNSVIKDMAGNATKVEIYENNKLSKVFYVGSNTIDESGTYFYMDKAKEPYICHIPGFKGYLNSRFFTNENIWRSKSIFSAESEQIKTIEVEWTEEPNQSFKIDNSQTNPQFFSQNQLLENNKVINLNKLKSYLKLWENLSFEGFPINLTPQQVDSISKTKPLITLKLTDKKGKITSLQIHKKGIFKDTNIQYDENGNALPHDIENFYAFINGDFKEVVQIQDFIFGKVMKKVPDFRL